MFDDNVGFVNSHWIGQVRVMRGLLKRAMKASMRPDAVKKWMHVHFYFPTFI